MSKTIKKNAFKTLKIIYGALILGVVFFLIAVLFTTKNLHFAIDTADSFTMIVPIMTLSGIAISILLKNNFLKMVALEDTVQSKLTKYQTASIIKGAMLEGPAFIGIVATSVTSNYFFILFAVIAVLVMLLLFPSKQNFIEVAQLSFEEKSKLDTL